MEGITLSMALMDAVPVLCFGASTMIVALRFRSPLFVLGAVLSTAAGCGKVLWKLILGAWGKNVRWLNQYFVPVQVTGFCLILLSLLLNAASIAWGSIWAAVSHFPACICFLVWLVGMGCMMWYRKNRFDHSARANWTAQTINCVTQGALLLGLLL